MSKDEIEKKKFLKKKINPSLSKPARQIRNLVVRSG
jgi:hypothetical protein